MRFTWEVAWQALWVNLDEWPHAQGEYQQPGKIIFSRMGSL
jgi:hypothetical protein